MSYTGHFGATCGTRANCHRKWHCTGPAFIAFSLDDFIQAVRTGVRSHRLDRDLALEPELGRVFLLVLGRCWAPRRLRTSSAIEATKARAACRLLSGSSWQGAGEELWARIGSGLLLRIRRRTAGASRAPRHGSGLVPLIRRCAAGEWQKLRQGSGLLDNIRVRLSAGDRPDRGISVLAIGVRGTLSYRPGGWGALLSGISSRNAGGELWARQGSGLLPLIRRRAAREWQTLRGGSGPDGGIGVLEIGVRGTLSCR